MRVDPRERLMLASFRRLTYFFVAFIALGLAVSSSSWAGEVPAEPSTPGAPAPLQESLPPDARAEYDAARLLFGDGDYSGAIAKFKRAHELSGDPRLLWNQAVCEKELRHYARAAELIRSYLVEGAELIDAQKRTDAQRILESLRQFSSRVVLTGIPNGATLLVDGDRAYLTPLKEPLTLDLGSHQIEVTYPGYQRWSRFIEVPGNDPVHVRVALQPEAKLAHLSIRTLPGASIAIDGAFVGEGRYEGSIEPGTHDIVVSARGRKTEKRRIDLRPASHRSMDISLEEQRSGRAVPWIIGGAALIGGAVVTAIVVSQPSGFEGPTGTLGTIDAR